MNILEARRRTLGGHILKKTAQGNPAIATGSLARRYPGITMQGWTEQDGTPTPETPVPIVSAGTWDETAQKWEYEIEISNAEQNPTEIQTVTLTSDRPLTKWDKLTKKDGQWGWEYKSAEIESYTDESVPGEYYSTTGQLSTGAQVWYETTTETFAPLTASEQEAMNALHTFRPTTVLSNDCECNMSLTYKTKKSMVGGGNPYGLEIGGIAGGGGGYEFEATNRIRTDYIPFYSPDGSRTYTIVGNPYNIANSNAYDNQKNALGSYEMTAGAFTPPAGTWFIRISFSKPDNSDFTQEELNQLIRTFDIERS